MSSYPSSLVHDAYLPEHLFLSKSFWRLMNGRRLWQLLDPRGSDRSSALREPSPDSERGRL